jgi:hypothetical protein
MSEFHGGMKLCIIMAATFQMLTGEQVHVLHSLRQHFRFKNDLCTVNPSVNCYHAVSMLTALALISGHLRPELGSMF